jgi:putative FmdB family regulatory protein
MPVYEYRCLSCGKTMDWRRPIEDYDKPGPQCPFCPTQDRMSRVFSPAATIFVGSGWAKDSYGLHPEKERKS